MDIDAIINSAQLPQKSASICIRSDLVARWEELHAQFRTASDKAESLAQPSPRSLLAAQLRKLSDEMAEHQVTFVFEALPGPEWAKLLDAYPPVGNEIGKYKFNTATFPAALFARCALDPKMTTEQAQQLLDRLSSGQADTIFSAAFSVNNNEVDIPFDGSVYAENPAGAV